MYELIITTTYNIIKLVVDNYNSPEVREILEQPYIVGFEMRKIKDKEVTENKKSIPNDKKRTRRRGN